jgi:lysine-specific demethylase/histidyl-hydroxylase NO66
VVAAERYTGGGGLGAEVRDQVHDEKILELLADGATLVVQGLHRLWPPLIEFAGALGVDMGAAVQVNAYLTPPGNRGFATHYDTHDVVVLQVSGHKHWRIHPPVLADPLERQPWGGRADEVQATASGEPALDVVLAPGDALYLPRGWLHAADAQDDMSLHLTLGLRRPTRYDIVESLLALAAGEAGLRAGFALGADPTDPDRLAPELRSTVAALKAWLDTVDSDTVARHLRSKLWSATRPAPLHPLAQAALLDRVDPGLAVRLRPGLRWRLVDQPDGVRLELRDRGIMFPPECSPALKALTEADTVRVSELPGLDNADRLVLVRRLLREAVVVPDWDATDAVTYGEETR